jgi:hypothetical protein
MSTHRHPKKKKVPPPEPPPTPAASSSTPPTPPKKSEPLPKSAWLRLGLNLLLGITLLAWVREFTDWWNGVSTALALGGILSWIGVVSKVIPDERQKEIRAAIGDWVFLTPRSWWVVGLLAAVFVVTWFVGVVEVENMTGPGETVVWLSPPTTDGRPESGNRVRSGERVREPYFLTSPRTVKARASGLPSKELTVYPWWQSFAPVRVRADGSFLRPVVLIGADDNVMKVIKQLDYRLEVRVNNGDPLVLPDAVMPSRFWRRLRLPLPAKYNGRLLLLGTADSDIEIPSRLKTELDKVFRQPGDQLFPPAAMAMAGDGLRGGFKVRAVLLNKDNEEFAASPTVVVHEPRDRSEIVQAAILSEFNNN